MLIKKKFMELQYIYLIHEREFIQSFKPIYKVGKTRQSNLKRFTQYPKGSALIFQSVCDDCDRCEKEIIDTFKKNYKQRKDIGSEYYEGDYKSMLCDITDIIWQIWNKQREVNEKYTEKKMYKKNVEYTQELEQQKNIRQKKEEISRTMCKIEEEYKQKLEEVSRHENYKQKLEEVVRKENYKQKLEEVKRLENHREELKEIINANIRSRYCCITCNYFSDKNVNLKKHISSKKHIDKVKPNEFDETCKYQCIICNKKYKGQSGLFYHNQKCKLETRTFIREVEPIENTTTTLIDKFDRLETILIGMATINTIVK